MFSIGGVFIYINDVIIIVNTLPEFIDRRKAVLFRAKEKRVSLGLPKFHFKSKDHEIKIIGSIFVNGTRQIDPSRLTGLVELPALKTVKDVRSFVGSINYIRDSLNSDTYPKSYLLSSSLLEETPTVSSGPQIINSVSTRSNNS
ncbi:hypothetical protein P9112_004497 [Eukaryota sp. TZLM1-RC]